MLEWDMDLEDLKMYGNKVCLLSGHSWTFNGQRPQGDKFLASGPGLGPGCGWVAVSRLYIVDDRRGTIRTCLEGAAEVILSLSEPGL